MSSAPNQIIEPSTPLRAPPRLHYGLVVLVGVVLTVFGSLGLGRFGYPSILPSMQRNMGLTSAQAGDLQSWNLVGYLLTVVPAGFLAARFGARRVISVSLLLVAAGMALTGLKISAIPSFTVACAGRFLTGIGTAGANVPAMGLLAAWFAARRRGLAMGVGVAGCSLALIVTGPLVPAIDTRYGQESWRVSWDVLAGMAAGIFVICALLLRNRPGEMGLAPVGASPDEAAQHRSGSAASALDWGLVYRSGRLWHLAAIYLACGLSYLIYATFFVSYLVTEGWTKADAGMMWLKIGVLSIASGFIWGSFSDRFGRRAALVVVFILQGSSYLMLSRGHSLPLIYTSAALFALTAWSVPALMAALSGDIFGPRLAPAALGLMTMVFGIGQALAPYVGGRIRDAAGSFAPAYLLAGAVALAGAAGAMLLRANTSSRAAG